jgi:hypothetical protein
LKVSYFGESTEAFEFFFLVGFDLDLRVIFNAKKINLKLI